MEARNLSGHPFCASGDASADAGSLSSRLGRFHYDVPSDAGRPMSTDLVADWVRSNAAVAAAIVVNAAESAMADARDTERREPRRCKCER